MISVVTKGVEKARLRYKLRKQKRKEIAPATLLIEGNNHTIGGLLNSGAIVTCLGKDCLLL